jgi:hypothetical protein
MIARYAIAGLTGLLLAGAASAGVYKWVDKDGKVHYSDKPVAGAQEQQIRAPGVAQPGSSTGETGGGAGAGNVGDTDNQDSEVAGVRSEQCALAQKRLQNYENAGSITREDASGKQVPLTADQRIDTIVQARRDVNAFCGGGAQRPPS